MYYAATQSGNGVATAAGVLGIIAVFLMFIPFVNFVAIVLGVLAIVFGRAGLQNADRGNGAGRGMAITGIVCGIMSVVIAVLFIVLVYATFIGIHTYGA